MTICKLSDNNLKTAFLTNARHIAKYQDIFLTKENGLKMKQFGTILEQKLKNYILNRV